MNETQGHDAAPRRGPGGASADVSNSDWIIPGICILLAAMVWMVFGGTLGHDFVGIDDDRYVYDNPHVAAGLSLRGIAWAFTHTQVGHWGPLCTISHMADCQFYGLQPWGHHLTNVLLHGMVSILLFLVLRSMTGALWRSAFVAAVFAIHPLRVESVAWVTERKDVLSGVFFMLTIAAYVHYTRKPRSLSRYLPAFFLFALGLMSKSMLVTLPFVLLLLDYWPLCRFAQPAKAGTPPDRISIPRRLVLEKMPFFALSISDCVVQMLSDKELIVPSEQLSLFARLANAPVSYVIYVRQMIYPARLMILYPHQANNLPVWEVALAILLLGAISTGVFLLRQSRPYLLVGWLWYLGMLVPVIGLIQSGWQAHADRYTYLPQIGVAIAIAWAAGDFCARRASLRAVTTAAAVAAIAALMWGAWMQTAWWRNDESLWTRVLALVPGNAVAENGFGAMLVKNGREDEGMSHYLKALEINPGSSEANYNLGNILLKRGQLDEAITRYGIFLAMEPGSPEAENNLGNALQQKGQLDEAIAHYQKSLKSDPDYADARNNLGYAFQLKGLVDDAIVQYQKALEIKPAMLETRLNLGIAFSQKGEMNEAITQFQKAVKINPGSAKTHNDLGLALLQTGKVEEAIGHFQAALKIEPGYTDARHNLGLALQQRNQ